MAEIIFPKNYFTSPSRKHRITGHVMFWLLILVCFLGVYYIFSMERPHGKVFHATMVHTGELYCEIHPSYLKEALADYAKRTTYLQEGYCGNESAMMVVPTGNFYTGETSYGAKKIIAEGRILGKRDHTVYYVTDDPDVVHFLSTQ